MAHVVFGRLHTEGQDGAVAQSVISLPAVERADVNIIAEGLGSIAGQVTDEH